MKEFDLDIRDKNFDIFSNAEGENGFTTLKVKNLKQKNRELQKKNIQNV